jgi:hypothetical protein
LTATVSPNFFVKPLRNIEVISRNNNSTGKVLHELIAR